MLNPVYAQPYLEFGEANLRLVFTGGYICAIVFEVQGFMAKPFQEFAPGDTDVSQRQPSSDEV
jgi:hypothetical protein